MEVYIKLANSHISKWWTQAAGHFGFRYFWGTVSLKRKTSQCEWKVKSLKRREKIMLYSGKPKKNEGHILVIVKASFSQES